jgi:ferredoxin--NADP+ reductase
MFMEDVPAFRFGGLAWLFLGVANTDSLLYDEEFTNYLQQYPENFRFKDLTAQYLVLIYPMI